MERWLAAGKSDRSRVNIGFIVFGKKQEIISVLKSGIRECFCMRFEFFQNERQHFQNG